jgi:hypothetical protein
MRKINEVGEEGRRATPPVLETTPPRQRYICTPSVPKYKVLESSNSRNNGEMK